MGRVTETLGARGAVECSVVNESVMCVPVHTVAACCLQPLVSKGSLGLETLRPFSLFVTIWRGGGGDKG